MRKAFIMLMIVALATTSASFALPETANTRYSTILNVKGSPSVCPNGCGAPVYYNTKTGEYTCSSCGCRWKKGPGNYIIILDPGDVNP